MLPMEPEEGMMESADGDSSSDEEDGNEELTPLILRRSTHQR